MVNRREAVHHSQTEREEEGQTRAATSTHLLQGAASRFSDGGPLGRAAVAAAQSTIIASRDVPKRFIGTRLSCEQAVGRSAAVLELQNNRATPVRKPGVTGA